MSSADLPPPSGSGKDQRLAELERLLRDKDRMEASRRQSQERENRLKRVLSAIRNVRKLIVSATDPQGLIDQVCLNLTDNLGYHSAWIALLDRDEKTVTMSASSGFKSGFATMHKRLEKGELPDCMKKALTLDKAIVVENPKTHCLDCPLAGEYDDRSEPGRYLVYDGRIYGYLAVSIPADYAHDAEEQGLFAELADDLSFALSKIENAEALYRTRYSIDNITDTVFWVDEDGRFIDVNNAACQNLGYDREDLLSMTIADIDPYFSRASWPLHWQEICRKGMKVIESAFHTRHGADMPVEAAIHHQQYGGKGYSCLVARNITERKQAEVERGRLLAAIEQAGDAILITDAAGIIQYINPSFEKTTGYSRAELLGKTPRILKSGEHDATFYRELWSTITSGRTYECRMTNRRKDGRLYTDATTISPVCDDQGTIVNYVSVKRDITEQLQLETQFQQAQKMQAVGRLTGGVAHDFNNILGVIIGYAEMALQEVHPAEPLHGFLEKILDAAQRSANIVRQLLAFARQQTIAPKVLDLNGTVAGTLRMLQRLIGEDIDLVWHPAAGLWPVRMDPAQVDQILANLCVNARDAIADTGTITIETAMVTFDAEGCADHSGYFPGEYVMLAVSDDGCGIDREILKNIFEPFFTTKGIGNGTGLGLATVYGIVKQNDGFINAYSESGSGTTFKLYLPRHAEAEIKTAPALAAPLARGRGETVLLVEDEPELLQMGKTMLEGLGYHVLPAGTPSEAMERAQGCDGRLDLLLTDVIMPGMNGRELADHLLKMFPQLKCLFMSGYTANAIAHHGVLNEDIHFIQKPFSHRDLVVKVRQVLDEEQC